MTTRSSAPLARRATGSALSAAMLAAPVLAAPVLAAAMLVAVAAPAQAQRVSPMQAGKFAQFCTSPRNGGQLICDAYITGMVDAYSLVEHMTQGGDTKDEICVPERTTGEAMRSQVLGWIRNHRDRMTNKVGEVVYTALHETYPCSGGTH